MVGPAGCGKSECIKTFALAERERGKIVQVQTVFTKAYESDGLMGSWTTDQRKWKDGLIPGILRKMCLQNSSENFTPNVNPVMKILQLDGHVSAVFYTLFD